MVTRHITSGISHCEMTVPEFKRYASGWLLDCEMRRHSAQTLQLRKFILNKFYWWLQYSENSTVDRLSIRQFILYVTNGHTEPGGRWGQPHENQPVKPATVQLYHRHLRACINWIVAEGGLDSSPMATIKAPIDRPDQVQPFTQEQIEAILTAAKQTSHPKRDTAICLFLLDTGLRVSELCSITFGQLDLLTKTALVEGKGQKKRSIYFGRQTSKALWSYLREEERDPAQPLFLSDGGIHAGEGLTRNGITLMMRRLAKVANIPTVRLSPHTFRHTFAIEFLRNGGNQFTLMALLGHTDVKMTQRYVTYAQADIAAQHRINSPVDRMRKQN